MGAAASQLLRQVRGQHPRTKATPKVSCKSQSLHFISKPRVRPHLASGPGSVRKVEMEWPRYKGHMVDALALEVDEGRGQLR